MNFETLFPIFQDLHKQISRVVISSLTAKSSNGLLLLVDKYFLCSKWVKYVCLLLKNLFTSIECKCNDFIRQTKHITTFTDVWYH